MTPKFVWKFNYKTGKGPHRMAVPFLAGSSNQIEPGDPIKLSAGSFVPLQTDTAMAGIVAIADHRITSAHLAGYYPAIIPIDGDVFQAELAAASNPARGADVYITDSTGKLAVSGTNPLGDVYDHAGFPQQQGNADVGDSSDRGTTVSNVSHVLITIKKPASYDAVLQPLS